MDVQALQSELQAIRSERETAAERIQLYSQRGRGRGRGRGFLPGRGVPQPTAEGQIANDGPGKGLSASLRDRLGSKEGEQKPAFTSRRKDEHDHRYSRQEWHERRHRLAQRDDFLGDGVDTAEEPQEPLPGSNTDRLASAVVVENPQEGSPRGTKRLAEKQNPAQQKRNKRLFGSLLGTLQKFQEEDQRFKRTKLAQSRALAEQRAEQQAQVENERIRERQKQEIAKARLSEINKKRELDLKLQAKEKEIGLALRVEREMNLTKWLKTAAKPPLLWLPREHTEDTGLLLEQRSTDVNAWKEAQLEKLERERDQLLSRYKPIPPQVKDEDERRLRREDVDMAELQTVDPDQPVTEPTPIEPDLDRYAAEAGGDIVEEKPEGDIAIAVEGSLKAGEVVEDHIVEGDGSPGSDDKPVKEETPEGKTEEE